MFEERGHIDDRAGTLERFIPDYVVLLLLVYRGILYSTKVTVGRGKDGSCVASPAAEN